MAITLFQLLGIDPALPAERQLDAAAALWPSAQVAPDVGLLATIPEPGTPPPDPRPLIASLQRVLAFREVRPGASGDRVGLRATLDVLDRGDRPVLLLADLPGVHFRLLPTEGGIPARLYGTRSPRGLEVVIEALPVRIELPPEWLGPPLGEPGGATYPGPGATLRPDALDGLVVNLPVAGRAGIDVRVRVRMTETGGFTIEPAVPIHVGPCRFRGLTCRGLHDLALFPSPQVVREHDPNEQPLEWLRHGIAPVLNQRPGVIAVRTVDFDLRYEPLRKISDVLDRARTTGPGAELVVEDVVLPGTGGVVVPLHGRAALRQSLSDRTGNPFDLMGARLSIPMGPLRLEIDRALLQTVGRFEEGPVEVQARLAFNESASGPSALEIGVADDWTVQLGVDWNRSRPGSAPRGLELFRIQDTAVRVTGFKVGLSVGRLASQNPTYPLTQAVQALVNVRVTRGATPEPSGFSRILRFETRGGRPLDLELHEVGYDRGDIAFPSRSSFPDGFQIVLANVVKLILEEIGWVTESNGGLYFSVSGGLAIDVGGAAPEGPAGDDQERPPLPQSGLPPSRRRRTTPGFEASVERLRRRVGGNPGAPDWLLDGVSMSFRAGPVTLSGFGTMREYDLPAPSNPSLHDHYSEFGLGLELLLTLPAWTWHIGGQLFHGTVSGTRSFSYLLAAVQGGPIPVGACQLRDMRGLFAHNLSPELPASQGLATEMRLFHWYVDHGRYDALVVREGRQLDAWTPAEGSWSLGLGASLQLPVGTLVRVDLLIFGYRSPQGTGLLFAAEVYLLRCPDPIGYLVLEVDARTGAWAVQLGIELDVVSLFAGRDRVPEWLRRILRLTGTLFFGGPPGQFALGRIRDQASWLTLSVRWQVFARIEASFAICLELVDRPEGPRAFGFAFTAHLQADFGVGSFYAHLAIGLIVGRWRNESKGCALLAEAEAALGLRLFWIFELSIRARLEYEALFSSAAYRRLAAELHIHLGFFPDVHVRFEKIWEEPRLDEMRVISAPLASGGTSPRLFGPARAGEPGTGEAGPPRVLVVGVDGAATIDPTAAWSLEALRGAAAPLPEEAPAALTPISTDAVIALDFKPSVEDHIYDGEPARPGVGTDRSRDLAVDYRLVSVSIERRPRGGAGAWISLVTAEETRWGGGTARALPAVTFRWDPDVRREGKIDPRRLLINSETPYGITWEGFEADERDARDGTDVPCCQPSDTGGVDAWRRIAPHVASFEGHRPGAPAPGTQRFSDSRSALRLGPGVIVDRDVGGTPRRAIRSLFTAGRPLATARFDEPATGIVIDVGMAGLQLGTGKAWLVMEAFRGLERVSVRRHLFSDLGTAARLEVGETDLTSLLIRVELPDDAEAEAWLDLWAVSYVCQRALDARREREDRCAVQRQRDAEPPGTGVVGWLPNHDYRIDVECEITARHDRIGARSTRVRQRAFFRTQGPLGTNSAAHPYGEVAPYIESLYPRGGPLYRREPVCVAFHEHMNLLTLVRPGAAPEHAPPLRFALAVERVGGEAGRMPCSATGPDWLDGRAGGALAARQAVVDASELLARLAPSIDPRRLRDERVRSASPHCPPPAAPDASQVLWHAPVDPGADAGEPSRWAAATRFVASVRVRGGPRIDRPAFREGDEMAFGFPAGARWAVEAGRLIAPAAAPSAGAPGGLHAAVFGELSWAHFVARTTLAEGATGSGLALGAGGPAPVLVLLESAGDARALVARRADGSEIARAALPADPGASLEVVAYDDAFVAAVGGARLRLPRAEALTDRAGSPALVGPPGAAFTSLTVEPLEAYRFLFETSRYDDFAAHIGSYREDGAAAELLAGTDPDALFAAVDVASAMRADAAPGARQLLFDRLASALAVPMQARVDRLYITRLCIAGRTRLLLIESPEPLPLADDVLLALTRKVVRSSPPVPGRTATRPFPCRVLSDGDQHRALVAPILSTVGVDPWPVGRYRLQFELTRQRYRAVAGDPRATYSATASVSLSC